MKTKHAPSGFRKPVAVMLLLLSTGYLVPRESRAQVFATGPDGPGYITTRNPISPDCVAPEVWTAYNGHYMCAAPPSGCQYGYASQPVLNSNGAWSYSCNGPPASPPPPNPPALPGGNPTPTDTALALCVSQSAQYGITLSAMTRSGKRSVPGGAATIRYYDNSTGPTWVDAVGNVGNRWSVSCLTYDATGQFTPANTNPWVALEGFDQQGGQGGGS